MRVHAPATALVILSACALGGTARAATHSETLAGDGLVIDSPCARSVRVMPDAGLHGQFLVEASADDQEEIDHLAFDSQGSARVRTRPGECWQRTPGAPPTLVLSVRVPASSKLTIDEAGTGRYEVGVVGGPLSLDLSGAASITDEATAALQVNISGAGTVHVGRAEGPAHFDVSGHGQVTVAQAAMPSLSVDLSGAGHLGVAAGHVGNVSVQSSGAGSVDIGADADDASVDLSGFGSVHFGKVAGQLRKDVSGFGSVTVGR